MSSFGGGSVIRADITPLGAPVIVPSGSPIFVPASQPPTVVQPGAPAVADLASNDWRFSSNTVLHNGHLYAVQAIEDALLAADVEAEGGQGRVLAVQDRVIAGGDRPGDGQLA